jgi:tetratricopeptide (TPR) repeat protein
MTAAGRTTWLRVALAASALLTLALCSASDPEREAKLVAIQAAIDGGRWDEAIGAARALVEANPGDAPARAGLGAALLGKARNEEKVVDPVRLEQAKLAGDAEAFLDPSLFRTRVRYDDALRAEAEAELRRALEEDRGLLQPYLRLATLYAETGDLAREKATVAAAAQQFAGDGEAAAALLPYGEAHFRAGENKEALALFAPLAAAFPAEAAVALDHGAALFATGEYDRGVEALEKASAAHPGHGAIGRTLGQVYMFRLRWKEAADAFAALAAAEPGDRAIPLHQAASLMPIDPKAARVVLSGLIAADPERRDQTTAVASNLQLALSEADVNNDDLVRLSHQLNQAGMPQIGAAVAGCILSREPRSIPGRVMLAYIYDNMRYHDLALARLLEAAAIIREDPAAAAPFTLDGLAPHFGRVYFNLQEWSKAAAEFARVQQLGPLTFAAGVTHEKLGDYATAYGYFRKVIDEPGAPGLAERAREHLENPAYAPYRK